MIGGVPVGTVCAYAGVVTPSNQKTNSVWSNTDCKAASPGPTPTAGEDPVTLIEVEGWLLCDGRHLGVAQHWRLFSVLGYRYGKGKDQQGQNTFRIPDYRGLFLRGVDAGAGMDPDAPTRTGALGSGTDSGVGSLQCDTLQEHTHNYDAVQTTTTAQSGPVGTVTGAPRQTTPPNAPARRGSETRPKNIAVNYIIKYR